MALLIDLPFNLLGARITALESPGDGSNIGVFSTGYDFALAVGQSVRAVAPGIVVAVHEVVFEGAAASTGASDIS